MNETRRKPTTGRQSPSLINKWHGIFYMPSCIDKAGHTKAFDYPVTVTGGNPEMFSSAGGTWTDNTSVWSRTCTNWATPVLPEDHITLGPQQGGSSPNWGDSLWRTAPPREGHPHGPWQWWTSGPNVECWRHHWATTVGSLDVFVRVLHWDRGQIFLIRLASFVSGSV